MNTVVKNSFLNYVSPGKGMYEEWRRNECEDFVPSERQKIVIAAVQSALDAKLYYTDEVRAFCINLLGISEEAGAIGSDRVEGGEFGMDCYYARQYIRKQAEFASEKNAISTLNPVVGKQIGVVVFNDFKRNTDISITEVSEDKKQITISGKRGAYKVIFVCTALQILNGVTRAHELGKRKTGIEALKA
jgi:hypothetical protein